MPEGEIHLSVKVTSNYFLQKCTNRISCVMVMHLLRGFETLSGQSVDYTIGIKSSAADRELEHRLGQSKDYSIDGICCLTAKHEVLRLIGSEPG